jgi:phosphoribosylanthranilate isomerase
VSARSRTRIKICGVRSSAIARRAVGAGADALGFVFARSSPRFIEPTEAALIVAELPPFVASVALTVDMPAEQAAELQGVCPTDYHQLHGGESVELARACGPRVIKAIRFNEATIDADLACWAGVSEVGAILIDGSPGGLGESFDWSLLAKRREQCDKPIILAGGLTPDNVVEAIQTVRPFAVDVSSGVESERGVKDPDLIDAFCAAVRCADRG